MHLQLAKEMGFSTPAFYLPTKRLKGAESNVSRVARLCWKHKIPPTIFYNEFLNEGKRINRSFFNYEIAALMNSYTDKSIWIEDRLNKLLDVNDGGTHSYRYLSDVLDKKAHGFLSKKKKWCPRCYKYRQLPPELGDATGIFDDLYWSVDAIQVCMLHGCSLRTQCPHCYCEKQPYLSTTTEPGFCHYCHKFLGDGFEPAVDHEEIKRQRRFYWMFYISTYKEFQPNFSNLLINLEELRCAYPGATSEFLGELMGCGEDVVRKWRRGKRKPKLESIFALQKALGLHGPHQLFLPSKLFMKEIILSRNLELKFNSRSQYNYLMLDVGIKEYLESMISGERESMGRDRLAKRFGVTVGHLKSRFPKECARLSEVHEHRRALEKQQRDADFDVQMDRALTKCISRGNTWTIEHILAELHDGTPEGMSTQEIYFAVANAKKRRVERLEAARSSL